MDDGNHKVGLKIEREKVSIDHRCCSFETQKHVEVIVGRSHCSMQIMCPVPSSPLDGD